MKRCEVCTNVTDLCKTEEVERQVEVTRCMSCKFADRLPWDVLVGLVLGLGLQGSQRIEHIIYATCDFFGKSEKELWSEVEQTEHQYLAMSEEPETEEQPYGR